MLMSTVEESFKIIIAACLEKLRLYMFVHKIGLRSVSTADSNRVSFVAEDQDQLHRLPPPSATHPSDSDSATG